MKVIVGSHNPVKITAVHQAFALAFPKQVIEVSGCTVESGVSEQPMSSEETLLGAKNRSEAAKNHCSSADYWVGIESGVEPAGNTLQTFHWVYILSNHTSSYAKSGTYYLPEAIAKEIYNHKDLGAACNQIFKRDNTGTTEGITGILTHGIIDRTHYHQDTVTLALIPMINTDLYMPKD